MIKYASVFSGAGGVDAGAVNFGLDYAWGIERNKLKWQVNRLNFPGKCILADVRAVMPYRLEWVDVLWTSPPCQHASGARRNTALKPHPDRFIGDEVCRYLHALTPDWFFLENVPLYRHDPSFERILEMLEDFEYRSEFRVIDFADYGIPMDRRRLILVANRTDAEIRFPASQPLRGWWEAVSPIWEYLERVDDFPTWQRESIETWVEKRDDETGGDWQARVEGYAVNSQSMAKSPEIKLTVRALNEPIFTLTCAHSERVVYAHADGTTRRLDQTAWARLMTLPRRFRLPRCYGQAIKCVGDMVPPSFVKQLMDANLKEDSLDGDRPIL